MSSRTDPAGSFNYDVSRRPPLGSKRLDMGPLSKRLQVNTVVDQSGARANTHFPLSFARENWVLEVKGRFGQVLSTRWVSRGELLTVDALKMAVCLKADAAVESFGPRMQIYPGESQNRCGEMGDICGTREN